jgi:Bacterial sugar transferase
VSRQLTDEMKAWTPWTIERILRSAVSVLPESERERFEEEWCSHIDEVPGQIGKLYTACGFLLAARKMAASLSTHHTSAYESVFKRAVDITTGSLFVILFAPLLLSLALALRLTSSGQVLDRHLRVGLNGQKFLRYTFFTFHKVRSVGKLSPPHWPL